MNAFTVNSYTYYKKFAQINGDGIINMNQIEVTVKTRMWFIGWMIQFELIHQVFAAYVI